MKVTTELRFEFEGDKVTFTGEQFEIPANKVNEKYLNIRFLPRVTSLEPWQGNPFYIMENILRGELGISNFQKESTEIGNDIVF